MIFLIFCMKLGDSKGRKVTEPHFWKNFLVWIYSRKRLQISPKSHTDIFLKNGSDNFFGFWPKFSTKYDLQFEWNLFFKKFAIWSYLTSQSSKFSCFLTIRQSSHCILLFLKIDNKLNISEYLSKNSSPLIHVIQNIIAS